MIIDAFTFFNELDLLELRLEYLNDVVDYFVIVESNFTHSGKPKSLIFLENRKRYAKYKDKIIYCPYIFENVRNLDFDITLPAGNYNSVHWLLENNQRNHILEAVKNFQDSDLIMVSDVDEIPNKQSLLSIKNSNVDISVFEQSFYYYDFYNMLDTRWSGTVITSISQLKKQGPQDLRSKRNTFAKIKNGGWHFSYFGGTEKIINKIESFAHQEYNKSVFKNKDTIKKAIVEGRDLYSGELRLKKVDLDILSDELNFIIQKIFHLEKMSIVVPTMWKYQGFTGFLKKLVDHPLVGEILIINNDSSCTPDDAILAHRKIKIYNFGRNIFVNPAWNLGVKDSQFDNICIMNDDVEFDLNLIDRVVEFLNPRRLLGLCPGLSEFNQPPIVDKKIHFEKFSHHHMFGFGCLMFIQKENWIPIPEGLDIYFGDDWMIETMKSRFDQTYLITDLDFFTPYATTTKTLDNVNHILNKERAIYIKELEKLKQRNFVYEPAEVEVINSTSKNLVIGAAIGYNIPQISSFVKSFRSVNKDDDLLLILDKTPSDQLKEFFEQYSVKCEYFYAARFLDMWPHNSRILKILEIVDSTDYKNVLMADVRDVVFQKNPFLSNIEGLILFLEDSGVTLEQESINASWIQNLFGKNVYEQIKNTNIICSGTILGSAQATVNLLKLMSEELGKTSLKNKMPVDQAFVNYLYYTDQLDNCKLNKNGDIVATVGLTVTSPLAKDKLAIKNNLVYINDLCPAIVHQYDRSPELINHFNNIL